jgi:hypothetical protein
MISDLIDRRRPLDRKQIIRLSKKVAKGIEKNLLYLYDCNRLYIQPDDTLEIRVKLDSRGNVFDYSSYFGNRFVMYNTNIKRHDSKRNKNGH